MYANNDPFEQRESLLPEAFKSAPRSHQTNISIRRCLPLSLTLTSIEGDGQINEGASIPRVPIPQAETTFDVQVLAERWTSGCESAARKAGRSDKQQQEQNPPILGTTLVAMPCAVGD